MPPTDPSPAPRPAKFQRDVWWKIALLAILGLLCLHFSRTMRDPWVEDDTWYGAVYSQAAHNNLRAGLYAGGVPATLYFGPLPIPADAYYVHHPTLLPLLITASFATVGEAEWSARLVPILASLASVIVLWFLVRDAAGPRAATLVSAVFAAVPMELHYGDLVDFEPVLTLWMLSLLSCLRRWQKYRTPGLAVATALCAALALWTDWPGYLLVLSIAVSLIIAGARANRRLGLLLLGLVGICGMLFLFQIHSANAAAWSDLWSALRMRLGNAIPTSTAPIAPDAHRFTWGDWLGTVLGDLHDNYLALTWLLVAGGFWCTQRWRRNEPGIRWLGWAALQLAIADAIYVILLRNESFIHDFAHFYLIGAVAILAGLGLEGVCRAAKKLPLTARLPVQVGVATIVVAIAVLGWRRSEFMRNPYLILDGNRREPARLIPLLGQAIDRAFPAGGTILANFDPYGSALTYYAQRPILTNMNTRSEWLAAIERQHPAGGVIWLDADGAAEILAALPGTSMKTDILGFPFAFWRAPESSKR